MARRRPSLEQDWREATTAVGLLSLLNPQHRTPKTTHERRKLRLVLCGAVRTIWDRLPHDDMRASVVLAERFALDRAGRPTLEQAQQLITGLAMRYSADLMLLSRNWSPEVSDRSELARAQYAQVAFGLVWACSQRSVTVARVVSPLLADMPRLAAPMSVWETAIHTDWHGIEIGPDPAAAVVRDLYGGPKPIRFADAWRTPTVTAIAEGIAADAAFDRLPVLADALEDAGCESLPVLTHCRRTEPHWQGCWVVDGVLGM